MIIYLTLDMLTLQEYGGWDVGVGVQCVARTGIDALDNTSHTRGRKAINRVQTSRVSLDTRPSVELFFSRIPNASMFAFGSCTELCLPTASLQALDDGDETLFNRPPRRRISRLFSSCFAS